MDADQGGTGKDPLKRRWIILLIAMTAAQLMLLFNKSGEAVCRGFIDVSLIFTESSEALSRANIGTS